MGFRKQVVKLLRSLRNCMAAITVLYVYANFRRMSIQDKRKGF